MSRVLGTAALSVLLACAGLTATVAPAVAAPAQPAHPAHPVPPTAHPQPPVTGPQVRLDGPAHGRAAVRALGADLPAAARVNGRSADELRALLTADHTAWVSTTGRVSFADPAPTAAPSPEPAPAATAALADTFALHSKPGSQHTIFLDFDGSRVASTMWNSDYGVDATTEPAWDPAGDGPAFSSAELRRIQYVWALVAEDYAPFDVDVTTQDPGTAALDRSGSSDPTWGTRVLITPSRQAEQAACGGSCGGIAFLDVIDHYAGAGNDVTSHDAYQPAWVFPQSLGQDAKSVAEAAAHEAGHTLGLEHDGNRTDPEYDLGHAAWAPIMGAAYYRPISQFSRGDYAGATNQQDDVAIIRAVLGARTDAGEGSGVANAGPVPAGRGYITSRRDVDVYDLGRCTGDVAVTASPAGVSPDLDIALTVLRPDGSAVARANPASAMTDARTATGLGATVALSSTTGDRYLVRVDGVGHGTATTGYTDYGSLGAYTLTLSGSCTVGVPAAPGIVATVGSRTSVTLTWTPPADAGSSPVTGYRLTGTDVAAVSTAAGTLTHTFTGLTAGTARTFRVAAVNAAGPGPARAVTVNADGSVAVAARRPGAPRVGAPAAGRRGGVRTASVRWRAPSSDGGAPLSGYQVRAYRVATGGRVLRRVQSTVLAAGRHRSSMPLGRGRWAFSVRAVNVAGFGPWSARTRPVRAR